MTRSTRPARIIISLGSNVGDSAQTIMLAAGCIGQLPGTSLDNLSNIYLAEPAFNEDQPQFYNAILSAQTTLSPEELLQELQNLELDFGRVRDSAVLPNSPRTLDLDLIDFEGEIRATSTLTLPHPGALERDFVVTPLLEIAPNYVLANAKVVNRNNIQYGKVVGIAGSNTNSGTKGTGQLSHEPQWDKNSDPSVLDSLCETDCHSGPDPESRNRIADSSRLLHDDLQVNTSQKDFFTQSAGPSVSLLPGKLSICATPIGNIKDITLRVLDTLKAADLIYSEDTRVTRKLLSYYDIHTYLERADEHTLPIIIPQIIKQLEAGQNIAYTTDAGMPGISDPGLPLINALRDAGLTVEVLPGASALTTALVASGFEAPASYFGGFLPRKTGKIRKLLEELAVLPDTILVFYESIYRTQKSLSIIAEIFPEREVAMARELTKLHEEVLRGSATEVATDVAARVEAGRPLKGEVVLLIDASQDRQEAARSLSVN